MYMNLKPKKHERISKHHDHVIIGFHSPRPPPHPPNLISCSVPPPPQLFWSEILGLPLKIRGGCYHVNITLNKVLNLSFYIVGNISQIVGD